MAPTQAAGGSASDPAAGATALPDPPDGWGNEGVVGDGRYRLTHRLGKGGMAEVFAAEDVRLGRQVAVKLLRADLAQDTVAKARFTREAQSVAGLNHHSVVAVYDSGEDVTANGDTVPFIVMEYVEGRTIRELLNGSEVPPVEEALTIVSGVLEALAYSHHHGIVHRDIKPANVIITNNGAVKVMDFGIARALHGAATTMTQTGMVMGTPQYLSPEQALGRAVDARSDLYATGCLLYELLALRPPFTGETPLSVVYQHVQDEPKTPSEVSERAPTELDGLVLRALAKEPDDRYQSAEEMHGEIQYALRMLSEEGANTGAWATGHLGHADSTAVLGATQGDTRSAPVSHLGSSSHGTPPNGVPPLIGHPHDGDQKYRRGWNRIVLVVVAAVLAASAGVFVALNANRGEEPGSKPTKDKAPISVSDDKREEPPAEKEEEKKEADPDPQDQDWRQNESDTRVPPKNKPPETSPPWSPSPEPSQEPSQEPSSPPPSEPPSEEPSPEESEEEDDSSGTTDGTSEGASVGPGGEWEESG